MEKCDFTNYIYIALFNSKTVHIPYLPRCLHLMNGYAATVNYERKMFTKWSTGPNVIKLFTAVSYDFT
jgi:hypothetical protein